MVFNRPVVAITVIDQAASQDFLTSNLITPTTPRGSLTVRNSNYIFNYILVFLG